MVYAPSAACNVKLFGEKFAIVRGNRPYAFQRVGEGCSASGNVLYSAADAEALQCLFKTRLVQLGKLKSELVKQSRSLGANVECSHF